MLIHEGSCNIKSKATQMAPGAKGGEGIKSKIRGVAKEAKLQIWLFNDVLVHLKNTKNKKKTNVSSTEYTWPLQLVWIKDNLEKDPEGFYFILILFNFFKILSYLLILLLLLLLLILFI